MTFPPEPTSPLNPAPQSSPNQRKRNSRSPGKRTRTAQGQGLHFERLEDRLALTVVISEFLANNDTGLRDAAGHRHDWIELQNTGLAPENVAGWYLTDELGNNTKYQIPSAGALTTLDPGEILVLFASGNNGEVGLVGQEIHTNFQLSLEPGYLALVAANGTTIVDDFNSYPQQTVDVAYGRGIGVQSHTTTPESLVGDSSPIRAFVPTGADQARDDHWKESGFDDSTWLAGTGSVGWDINGTAPNLLPYIGRPLLTSGAAQEVDVNNDSTVYVRYQFDVSNKEQLTSLTMNLRFDDGFIAYLNGKEVARANFAEDFRYPQPQWNSFAGHQQGTSSSSGSWNRVEDSDQEISFNLTPYLEILQDEGNVLAFHGVNSESSGSGGTNLRDFLIDAELVADRAGGATQVGYLATPSPGKENGLSYVGYIDDTEFSLDRGFYDSPQSLEISTAVSDAVIRYTTDFSEPSLTNGLTYAGPISLTTTTVVRARAFKEGYISTNVDTQTYLFLQDVLQQSAADVTQPYATWGHDKEDEDSASGYNLDDEADWDMDPQIVTGNESALVSALQDIPTISIVTNWNNLWSGTPLPGTGQVEDRVAYEPEGIYIHGRSSERPNSLEYFTADGSASLQVDSVIEIQGHSSPGRWNTDKLSLQVKFKAPYGDRSLSENLFVGTADEENAVDKFDTLILDAMYNYTWTHANVSVQADYARFVTDQVTADLQNLASGGDAPHGKYVHLYLDGFYWGLYNVHERPDEHFAAAYYGGEEDDYFVVKQSTNDIDGLKYTWVQGGLAAEAAYDQLLQATREDMSVAGNYAAVEQLLDVEQFIDYMIVHMYAGNENDWPHNNWYASFNPVEAEGRWRFHAWDQEHAFPTNDNGDSFTQNVNLTDDNDPQTPGELFANLIVNEEFRLKFSDRVQELMRNDGLLTPAVARAVYEARTDEIDQAILGESARWGDNRDPEDPYTRADFLAVKNGVLNTYFPVRTGVVLSQFDVLNDWLVDDAAPTFNQYGGEVSPGFQLVIGNPNATGSVYYTLDGSDPRDRATNGPSSSAILYTGALTLSKSTRVRARVFADSAGAANDWSAEVNKAFSLPEALPLRIVELMYNPAGTSDLEYIELLNTGSTSIDLAGVRITDFSAGGYTFASLTLGPGERIVVPENVTAFQAAYPGVTNVTSTAYSGALSNGGEPIALRDALGNILQSFTFDDEGDWPTAPDGTGPSLEYVGPLAAGENPLDGAPADPFDDPSNWQPSSVNGGTPGAGPTGSVINADFDGSHLVDGRDFLTWQRHLGTGGASLSMGDANADAMVDATDLRHWQTHYGAMTVISVLQGPATEPQEMYFFALDSATSLARTSSVPARRARLLLSDVQAVDEVFANEVPQNFRFASSVSTEPGSTERLLVRERSFRKPVERSQLKDAEIPEDAALASLL